jgi:PAS domain S-box-containing protein
MSTALLTALAWHAWSRRPVSGAEPFSFLMLAGAEWTFAQAMQLASSDLAPMVFWLKMQTIGLAILPVAWIAFTLHFTGRSKIAKVTVMSLLAVVSSSMVVLAALNDLHGWIWSSIEQRSVGDFSVLVAELGPGYAAFMAIIAVCLVMGTVVLFQRILRSRGRHKVPMIIFIAAMLLPWAVTGLYQIGLRPFGEFDPTALAITFSSVCLSLGAFRFRMFDTPPAARSTLLERMRDGVVVVGLDGSILEMNNAAAEILGCDAAMAVGRPVAAILPRGIEWEDGSEKGQVVHRSFSLGENHDIRHFDLRVSPQYDRLGHPSGRLVELRDTTDERERENALVKLSRAIEQIPDIVIITDVEGNIEYVNPKFSDVTGYRKGEVIGKNPRLLKSGTVSKEVYRHLWETISSGGEWRGELTNKKKDGSLYWVAATISAIRGPQGQISHFVAVQQDITERKRVQAQNRRWAVQQEALTQVIADSAASTDLSSLLEHSLEHTLQALGLEHGGITVAGHSVIREQQTELLNDFCQTLGSLKIDLNHAVVIEDWHGISDDDPLAKIAWQAMGHGYRATAFVPLFFEGRLLGGMCVHAVSPREWASEEVALMQTIGSQLGGAAERLSLLHKTQEQAHQLQRILDTVRSGIVSLDGTGTVVLANAAAREYLALLAGVEEGDVLISLDGRKLSELLEPRADMLPHVVEVDGPSRRVFEVYANRGLAKEEWEGCTLLIRDVTESWQARERAQSQDRLAAVGQLAAGIAHDFNNFLGTIILYTELLLQEPKISPKAQEKLATILQQARRAGTLTRQILDFSRRSVMERNPLDLQIFLKDIEALMGRTMPKNIRFHLDWNSEAHMVNADPAHLQQVFMNLVINARDVMPNGGELYFEVTECTTDLRQTTPLTDMPPGKWIRIRVSDTGSGIPPEILPRIFEPFFTTKTPGVGTGLGLAQVYGIVKQHDGFIDVESTLGEGTSFTVYLPALEVEFADGIQIGSQPLEEGNGETILVVEDDPTGREALTDILESQNYKVLTAIDGVDALNQLEAFGGGVDIVLCDMVMPRMGGAELCTVLRQQYPEVKIILMSGYPLVGGTRELLDISSVTRIQKPASLKALSRAMRNARNGS